MTGLFLRSLGNVKNKGGLAKFSPVSSGAWLREFSQLFLSSFPYTALPFCHFCWLFTQLHAATDACKDEVAASLGVR